MTLLKTYLIGICIFAIWVYIRKMNDNKLTAVHTRPFVDGLNYFIINVNANRDGNVEVTNWS